MPHAFGAVAGSACGLLAVLAPGVDRFGYFRALCSRIQQGLESFDSLLAEQDRRDVHFLDASGWRAWRIG